MKNYVLRYIRTDSSALFYVYLANLEDTNMMVYVGFDNRKVISPIDPIDDQALVEFYKIARSNSDTAFNRPTAFCFPYICIAERGVGFRVTANKILNTVPVGESLNRFFPISYFSAGEFIRKGYPKGESEIIRFTNVPLDSFNKVSSIVSADHMEFNLKNPPANLEDYVFYFEYYDNSGIHLRDSLSVTPFDD